MKLIDRIKAKVHKHKWVFHRYFTGDRHIERHECKCGAVKDESIS